MVSQSIQSDIELPKNLPESHQTAANTTHGKLFSLQGRTVVITGAGRGLGITLAAAVLEAGGDAICLDILPAPSAAEWKIIETISKTSNVHAIYHTCDITDEEAVSGTLSVAAEAAARRGRPIRGLISCAGIQQMTEAIDYPVDGFRKIMDVNVTGSFLVSKHTARLMRSQGTSGSIVLIASMSGQIANRVCRCGNIAEQARTNMKIRRAFIAQPTTLRKPPFSKCPDHCQQNGGSTTSASIHCRLVTSEQP